MKKIVLPQLSEVMEKQVKIILYLLISGGISYVSYIMSGKPEFMILGPVFNYIGWQIEHELKNEGITRFLKKE